MVLCYHSVAFQMLLQELVRTETLLANITTHLSKVKMVCQVTNEIFSVCKMRNGLTQVTFYITVCGRYVRMCISIDPVATTCIITIMPE